MGRWLARGTIDFAGGIVVRTTAGISALVASVLIGTRDGFPHRLDPAAQPRPHHGRCRHNLGRLVRLQRRQRLGGGRIWSALGTFVLVKALGASTGLRVSAEEENEGLDLATHGERAYDHG